MHVCCALFVLAELLSIAQGPGAPKTLAIKVLHDGDPAPGIPGATIAWPSIPQIDAAGRVYTQPWLTGPGIDATNNIVHYFGLPGQLQIITRESYPAPDLPGLTIGSLYASHPMISEDGWIAFSADLKGAVTPGLNDRAAFVGPPGDIRLLARTGDQAPGLEPGVVLAKGEDFRARLSDSHTVFLRTGLAGTGVDGTNDAAFYTGTREELKLVWRKGMPAPGTEPGVTFAWGDLEVFNDAGQIAIRGSLTGPGIDGTNDMGLWLGGPGALTLIARDGDPVPGFPDGVSYLYGLTGLAAINSLGDGAGGGKLQGGGITADNDKILYVAGAEPFEDLLRKGDPVPEAGPGGHIDYINNPFASAQRCILVMVRLAGPLVDGSNAYAVYFGPYDAPAIALRDADPAPWFPDGTTLTKLNYSGARSAMADSAVVVCPSDIDGPGVTDVNRTVLWMRPPLDGQFYPLMRGGADVDGRIVDLGTSVWDQDAYENQTGGSDGHGQGLNDAGLLAARVRFYDGTEGVYTLRLVWPGDLNCDGVVNAFDIDGFVLALTDAAGYLLAYPQCPIENADCNADGALDAFDVDPFVDILVGTL